METLSKLNTRHSPLDLSLHQTRPRLSTPFSSLSFRTPPPQSLHLSHSHIPPIKASSISHSQTPKPQNSFLKTTLIAAVTTTALFFARFNLKPLIAAPIPPTPTVEEQEISLEEHLSYHPEDIPALKTLMELKIKNQKVQEAIVVIEQLMKLEPADMQWPLMKAHMHSFKGEFELAKQGFNDILSKDPFCVEAYNGLVMAALEMESTDELKEVEKKIGEGIEMCKKEMKNDDLRDLKLLFAQIRVIDGDYSNALKLYEELVKEEPRDFRPYLCQGMIYTLLKKKDEAGKNFDKYRRLVPKGHLYAQYFDDNMMATKLFSQKVENEQARNVQKAY